MPYNRATIYSNGIADFQRVFKVAGKSLTAISIPVRQEHLGDVLASLTISGDVKIVSPPSFQPANVDDGNIVIDTVDAVESLASQLAGSTVSIVVGADEIEGKLVGLQNQQVATDGEPIDETSLVILSEGAIRRFSLRDIQGLKFLDPVIQAEIEKSLSRSLREIKPNSTFVELSLRSLGKATVATVQYTIPAAAWKISYRILVTENGDIEFQGYAIVDNNTDEDWDNFIVSVVIGQPNTFSTDLAESKIPQRSHVNVVQESALGSVEVEQAMAMSALPQESMTESHYEDDAVPSMRMMSKRDRATQGGSADMDVAIVDESGDFCVYESAQPVSIDAHRSAVIPVFQTSLADSSAVLFYKVDNHIERPFRAIQFKNTTDHSLGRGVCTVYDHSTFAGTCILPSTRPGDQSLLVHALETGVRIHRDQQSRQNRRIGLKIADGVAYDSHHVRVQVNYIINNNRSEGMPFILDHDWRIGSGAKVECHILRNGSEPVALEFKRLKHGIRLEFPLLDRDVLTVAIVESKVRRSRIQLIDGGREDVRYQVNWLFENIVDTDLSLSDDPHVRNCIEVHKLLMEKSDQISHAYEEIAKLEKRQERLRKNIQTGGGEQQNLKWQQSLAKTEDAIVQLEEAHIPVLEKEQVQLREQLDLGLRSLILEWNE